MISYTVSFTVLAPESIPRADVEQALWEANLEFRVRDSTLLPLSFSVTAKTIRMADGTVVLANVKPGQRITAKDEAVIAKWVEFCRERREQNVAKAARGKSPFASLFNNRKKE